MINYVLLVALFCVFSVSLQSSPPLPVGGFDCGEEVFPGEDEGSNSRLSKESSVPFLCLLCSGQYDLKRNYDVVGDYCCCCCGLVTGECQDAQSKLCKLGCVCSLLWRCTCGANHKAIFCKGGPCWSGLRAGIGKIVEVGLSLCCMDFIWGTEGFRFDCHEEL